VDNGGAIICKDNLSGCQNENREDVHIRISFMFMTAKDVFKYYHVVACPSNFQGQACLLSLIALGYKNSSRDDQES
jgi:hypothetical protein